MSFLKNICKILAALLAVSLLILILARTWIVNAALEKYAPETIKIHVSNFNVNLRQLKIEDLSVTSSELGSVTIDEIQLVDFSNLSLENYALGEVILNGLSITNSEFGSVRIHNIQLLDVSELSVTKLVVGEIKIEGLSLKTLNNENIKFSSLSLKEITATEKQLNIETLKLAALELEVPAPQLSMKLLALTVNKTQVIMESYIPTHLLLGDLSINAFNANSYDEQFGKSNINFSDLRLENISQNILDPKGELSVALLNINNLFLENDKYQREILVGTLGVNDFHMLGTENIKIKQSFIAQLDYVSAEIKKDDTPWFFQLDRFSIENAVYTANQLELAEIKIGGGSLRMTVKENGEIDLVPNFDSQPEIVSNEKPADDVQSASTLKKIIALFLSVKSKAVAALQKSDELPEVEKSSELSPSDFAYEVKSISLEKFIDLNIIDESLGIKVPHHLILKSVSLSELSSNLNASHAELLLELEIENSALLHLKANLHPHKKEDFSLQANFKHLELLHYSPYAEANVGYEIDSGQMDLDLDVEAAGNKLNGEAKILLRKIDLKSVNKDLADSIAKEISMPLPTALNVLKDKNDDVKLDVPIEGDLDDPNFGIGSVAGILSKKTLKGVTFHYLKSSLLPGGLLIDAASFFAGSIYEELTAIPPIVFEKNKTSVNPDGYKVLKNVVSLLNKKSKLLVKICPVVALDEGVDEEGRDMLATQRAQTVRAYFIASGLAETRLMRCKNKTDDKKYSLVYLEVK